MIGKNIMEIRKNRGYTLSELAEKARISKSYLSSIERNLNQNPSIQVLEKISFVLDVDLKTLLLTGNEQDQQVIEREWLEFVKDLKSAGVEKEQIQEIKTLIEFIKWQNEKVEIE
ncbi:helix-turn-helix domain-containing protein [Pseudalkalibacillus caeni]|uniref:Helix-turn-helix transcriptional regulator n=1 Tax=Exobacillus caeni TaxID=2574798 RepID=A0A5R9F7N5_9BACL|nr:helix-turn-helix transcriptional regulator [Pseudalkalibacillus caeni]TLS35775.1 helix-turn-helix transcriptional regulator [Pseudalkalibacillus caeni]